MDRKYLLLQPPLSPTHNQLNIHTQFLSDDDTEKDSKIIKHTTTYPKETTPLLDTALSFGGKPRTVPQPQRTFTPVGHICLGLVPAYYEDVNSPFAEGSYWISNFYVSRALQFSGLGRAAMDTVESIATSEPLNARMLGLNAINTVDHEGEQKYKALKLPMPPVNLFALHVVWLGFVCFFTT